LKLIESLNTFLPEINIITPKNEVDYFGFSYYLSNKLQLNYNYSFSSWVHGWIFNDLKYIEQFNTSQYSPHNKIVANDLQKDFLENYGFDNIITAGYPYIYIKDNPKIKRYKNSLLIIPPKDSHNVNHIWNEESFIDYICQFKKDFENIYFCIHQECFRKKKWLANLDKNNIKFVVGANTFDSNSLLRTKYIFQHFEYVHAPTIGSAIAYAAIDGCKVSLSENYLEYKMDGYKKHPLYNIKKEYLEYETYTKSKKYIKSKYDFLFREPINSIESKEWAKTQLGMNYIKTFEEISNLLGWHFKHKIKYYPMKYFNSIKNKIIKN
tara:strand:+ start:4437 stop:5405 length:969 start_codon:yes stop_codon:yes gene_type:complete